MMQDIISDNERLIFQWLFHSCLSELICIIGVVTNISNIIIFIKLGFKDAVNISLFGLAVSDMGCLLALLWANVCFNPAFINLDLPFEPEEVQYITGAAFQVIFSRVTCWITAFISMERCLCVTVPLKIKNLFNAKRVAIIIAVIVVAVTGPILPVFYTSRLAAKFSPRRNKTVIGLVFTDDQDKIQGVTTAYGNVFVPLAALVLVIVCTAVLVVKLQSQIKWRKMSVGQDLTGSASVRDQKVTKMIIAMSSFFIVCYIPVCLEMIAIVVDQRFSLHGQFANLFVCISGVCFTLEAINSAANMLIYYKMSTKYRKLLHMLLLKAM